jgi:hypothetical protein
MNAPLTIGFANLGRTRDGQSSSIDRDALEALRDALPRERAVVMLCEINEGDRNDELALAKRVFKGWKFYNQGSREPVGLSPDMHHARGRVTWVPDTSVPRWSPTRSVNVLHLYGENTSLIGGHPAAGAYHGDRPAAARRALIKSWDATFAAHRMLEASLHKRGRNVVWAMDVNRVDMPPVVPGEREVYAAVTDHARVLPADGWEVRAKFLRRVPFRIDSHDGQIFRVRFIEKD